MLSAGAGVTKAIAIHMSAGQSSSTQEDTQGRSLASVLCSSVLGGMHGHGTSRIHPRAEQSYQELHTSTPLQSLSTALSRTSAKSFLCLNFEYEERKTNYTALTTEGGC